MRRLLCLIVGFCTAVGLAILLPTAASAGASAACAAAWNSSSVYTGGMTASHNGRNWQAKWWTQNETPGTTGEWGVWADQGTCDGGPTTPPTTPPPSSGFVVSEAQFNQMFPSRNSFYTYSGLTAALSAYPAFATTGGDTVKRQEAAAFLANVHHETGGLVHIVEQNTANYPHYCDSGQPYGCPAGQAAYYGRGPIQLSWNFNYKAAGDALGINLLNDPYRVERDAAVAWKTGLWYWNTQNGPGTMTGHNAMVNQAGFGQTIRSINGALECDGKNPAQVQSRVTKYQQFAQILGVPTGANLYC
ncbi:glycoside hydrolase family 19 protein [Streptomyces sp. NPDC026092]|uniref:glycoside hydrolase family 19 protein n=1 Tax=Streptomyces sp. NPDC026092 TaxID=3154797 RepID=UPI0033F94CB0